MPLIAAPHQKEVFAKTGETINITQKALSKISFELVANSVVNDFKNDPAKALANAVSTITNPTGGLTRSVKGKILSAVGKEQKAASISNKIVATTHKSSGGNFPASKGFAENNPSLPKDHLWSKASPFKNKSADELHDMFIQKGFDPKGPNPKNGLGSYVNPKNKRADHIDPQDVGRYKEPNHVDVSRSGDYKGPLEKKRFGYAEG